MCALKTRSSRTSKLSVLRSLGVLLLLALAPAAQPVYERAQTIPGQVAIAKHSSTRLSPEEQVLLTIDAIRAGHYQQAQQIIEALLAQTPNYRLAQLLQADLYAMRVMPLSTIGGASDKATDRLEDLRQEARVRYNYRKLQEKIQHAWPANLVKFSSQQKYAILVDISASRLFLFSNQQGTPNLVTSMYVTIGKLGAAKQQAGDQRTPLGVYFVTGQLSRSYLDKQYGEQADMYGVGAWPISYPNELDRQEKRSGYGIWLHGSPEDTYARAPRASNGCIVLTNQEMQALAAYLEPGTPVVVTEKTEWLAPAAWLDKQKETQAQAGSWLSQHQETTQTSPEQLSLFATYGQNSMVVGSFLQTRSEPGKPPHKIAMRAYWKQENQSWQLKWQGPALQSSLN